MTEFVIDDRGGGFYCNDPNATEVKGGHVTSIKVPKDEGTRVGGRYQLRDGPIGRVVAVEGDVATVELGPPVGVAADGTFGFVATKPWQKRLGEITDPDELKEWAIVHLQGAIAEHPNEEDRSNALLALGILIARLRP